MKRSECLVAVALMFAISFMVSAKTESPEADVVQGPAVTFVDVAPVEVVVLPPEVEPVVKPCEPVQFVAPPCEPAVFVTPPCEPAICVTSCESCETDCECVGMPRLFRGMFRERFAARFQTVRARLAMGFQSEGPCEPAIVVPCEPVTAVPCEPAVCEGGVCCPRVGVLQRLPILLRR